MKLSEAIEVFSSVTGIARILETSTQNVSNWHERIPRGRQFELQAKSGGRLKADGFDESADYLEIAEVHSARATGRR